VGSFSLAGISAMGGFLSSFNFLDIDPFTRAREALERFGTVL
jgi:hypothetical protein